MKRLSPRFFPAILLASIMLLIPEDLIANDDYDYSDYQNATSEEGTEGDYMNTSTEETSDNQLNQDETGYQEDIDEDEMDGVQSYDSEEYFEGDEDMED
ncbi:hypothetical protein GZ77_14615 [Endozoicomonas montiporae]|uniref:Uncharacterized protein n=2 Tax=Endozoicomonas montiporae TaxID=1027273 RepID=A0A081N534_9GAMM|nr:hypothetical protein [Endozoicomonas montiporae]AMO57566.1 hypothetical protein EZMO1_3586 [Endozoicomonas montiporae CL-33]KEQ13557.1 hypothetical protein GZ77_14615 [Endozoicomonas montiporae]